jgi:hypothetical protein
MFDPDEHLPRLKRNMVYLGACLIAGARLDREKQVNVKVLPTISRKFHRSYASEDHLVLCIAASPFMPR